MRLAARIDRPWARVMPNLLMLVSHHGYSSGRAMLCFVVFVLFGALMYSVAVWGFEQPFVPFEDSARTRGVCLSVRLRPRQSPNGGARD